MIATPDYKLIYLSLLSVRAAVSRVPKGSMHERFGTLLFSHHFFRPNGQKR
jgi:hypothetical protein